jgi:hypothetical protein
LTESSALVCLDSELKAAQRQITKQAASLTSLRNSRTIGAWQSCGGVVGAISKDDAGVERDPVCFSCLLWQLLGIHNIFQFGRLGEYHPTNHQLTFSEMETTYLKA